MKTVSKYIIAGVICMVTFHACNDKLELTNPNQLSPETFLKTPAQVQSAVNAVYSNTQTHGLYSRGMFFSMDNMGHDNEGNPQLEADKRQWLEFTFDPSHGLIRAYWESCYRGINKANFVTSSMEEIDAISTDQLPQATKDRYIGEVKFMRAYYYFLLATRFGNVPLITELPETGEGFPISPVSEVYQQIITDLTAAVGVLPKKSGDGYEAGRATSDAAHALLGKTYLYMENYDAAKTAFSNILGDYELEANYLDNFLEETEHGVESIFEIQYQEDIGTSDQWNSDANGLGLNESTFRGQEYGWNDWFNVYPSDDLLSAYEPNDPRYEANFYSNGDSYAGGTVALPLSRVAGWRKYQNYYKRANENINSSINFKIIRYADVLLMMAEIENELDNPGDAIDYLNEVRTRVGMPLYGTPEMDAIYPVGTKQEIFEAIVHERQVELAGEQVRFPDLVRWGLAEEELSQYGFTADKHELFPIPQNEINANNAIENSDQNPGYN